MLTISLIPPPAPLLTCLLVAGDGVCVDVFLIFLLTDGVVLYPFSCLIRELRSVTAHPSPSDWFGVDVPLGLPPSPSDWFGVDVPLGLPPSM